MTKAEEYIESRLLALRDEGYHSFQCGLMPTVSPEAVIGVRTPALRALARELANSPEAADFITVLPHRYYEENNLHAFLIERIKDFEACIAAVERFLPYIDNWATCDSLTPKVFGRHLPELLGHIRPWLLDSHTYTIRFGIEMLMCFYLDDAFSPEYPALVAELRSGEYYVNMMIAWYFATALAKQYDAVLPYIEQQRLDKWTHNKAIQKSIESYRITDEQKSYLRTLRIK